MSSNLSAVTRPKTVRTSVTMSAEDHDELQRIARQKKVTLSWMIRHAVERFLEAESPLFRKSSQ